MQDNHNSTASWKKYWEQEGVGDAPVEASLASYQTPIYELLKKLIKEKRVRSLLSAGCGQDVISFRLKQDFQDALEASLLDISKDVLQWNRRLFEGSQLKAHYIEGDLFHMPLEDNSFDLVFNTGVLEHFEKDEQVAMAKEVMRVLRPGGIFVTANPSDRGVIYKYGMKVAQQKGIWPFGKEVPIKSLSFMQQELNSIGSLREQQRDFVGQLNFLSYVDRRLRYFTFPFRMLARLRVIRFLFDTLLGRLLGTYLLVSVMQKKAPM